MPEPQQPHRQTGNAALNPAVLDPAAQDWNLILDRIARVRDRTAFVALFDHFAPRIKGYLMRNGFAESEAEELAQDTMLQVWQKAGYFDPQRAAASTWIYTIARNKQIDRLRKHRPIMLDMDDLLIQPDDAAQETTGVSRDIFLNQARLVQRLTDAIKDLPKEQAELVQKAFFEDKSHAVIAAETKIPLGTVKSRLRAGLARLRQNLFSRNTEDN